MLVPKKQYILYASRLAEFHLYGLGDLHDLNVGCAYDDFQRDRRRILADPFAFVIILGDMADFIAPGDPRWDPAIVGPKMDSEDYSRFGDFLKKRLRRSIGPFAEAGKLLGIGIGNHEWEYMHRYRQANLHTELCDELGVPSLGYSSFLRVVFCRTPLMGKPILKRTYPQKQNGCTPGTDRTMLTIFTHHGAGAAMSDGGQVNRLARFMEDNEADLYFIGHLHSKQSRAPVRLECEVNGVGYRHKRGAICGGYLTTYTKGVSSWGERRGFRPTPLGPACAFFRPQTRELKVLI